MKRLATFFCSLLVFCACGGKSTDQAASEGKSVELKTDTASKDTLEIEKRKAPVFPKDDGGTEKMDEIVNRAKNQRL